MDQGSCGAARSVVDRPLQAVPFGEAAPRASSGLPILRPQTDRLGQIVVGLSLVPRSFRKGLRDCSRGWNPLCPFQKPWCSSGWPLGFPPSGNRGIRGLGGSQLLSLWRPLQGLFIFGERFSCLVGFFKGGGIPEPNGQIVRARLDEFLKGGKDAAHLVHGFVAFQEVLQDLRILLFLGQGFEQLERPAGHLRWDLYSSSSLVWMRRSFGRELERLLEDLNLPRRLDGAFGLVEPVFHKGTDTDVEEPISWLRYFTATLNCCSPSVVSFGRRVARRGASHERGRAGPNPPEKTRPRY